MSIASSYSFDVFLVQWDFARTILRLWFVPVVEHTFVKYDVQSINLFASKYTKTRLKIYDRISIDIYLAHAIRGCKYDRVYFDVFYLHLWTNISQRELKMGPCHQYIYSHWRDHTHCPGKNIKYQDSIFFVSRFSPHFKKHLTFLTFFIIFYNILNIQSMMFQFLSYP